jgi:RNA polymerase sigma-70 factor (ECF subfamily)
MNRQQVIEQLPGLRRYARALIGNTWAADDLVQDTLERACSQWRFWTAGSDLRAWLFTLMHNLHANQARSASRSVSAGRCVDPEDVAGELAAPETDADLSMDLQRCLLQLPQEQRAVLLLVTLEDLSYEEVARVLDIPNGTVMSRLSRARSRLRELMDRPAATAATPSPTTQAPVLRRLK